MRKEPISDMIKEKSANDPWRLFERPKPSCRNCRFAAKGINTVICHLNGMAPPVRKIFRPQATVCGGWQPKSELVKKTE